MKTRLAVCAVFHSLLISLIANSFVLIERLPQSLWIILPVLVMSNVLAGVLMPYTKSKQALVCRHGTVLLYAFYVSMIVSVIYQIVFAVKTLSTDYMAVMGSCAVCVVVNGIVFWNGILCVYFTSTQLGVKWRVIGIVCGLIPVANLIALFFILKTTTKECVLEMEKGQINKQRCPQAICATKYPILLVHGVFFRDFKFFNYWGRIPAELTANGANVFYGNHASAASIADSAAELTARIARLLDETGAEKVNIIAHSKGGLDCRYAMAKLGIADRVASLTTINTPHRGCLFADYLLSKIPSDIQNKVADTYNTALKKLGEADPDFLAAVNDLTDAHCQRLDAEMPTPEGVYCQSVGSVLPKAVNGKFPLNFSYHLVKHFSGENDGLVSERSFEWGENYVLLRPHTDRGISHGDMIDLNRENIPGFDVREFYVNLVSDLKNRGL